MLMACDAGECGVVSWIDVAVGARCPLACVGSGVDREPGVIECRSEPRSRGMARSAGRREARSNVVRVGRARIIRRMAGITVGWSSCVVSVNVATRACDGDVRPGQRE